MATRPARDDGRIVILHLIISLEIGGAEMALSRLVRQMDRRHFRNLVVSMIDGGALEAGLAADGIEVQSLGMKRGRPDPRGLVRLVRLMRRVRPHIVMTWLYHADLMGLLARWGAATPALVWNIRCSDMDMREYSFLSRLLPKFLASTSSRPAAVVTNSSVAQRVHEGIGYRPKSWHVIPNGFDTDSFRPDPTLRAEMRRELGYTDRTIAIGLVARYDPMKDHETFFRAAGLIARDVPDVRFVAIGRGVDGQNAALADLIRLNGLDGKVALLGERRDMERCFNGFDIATLTSAFGEGFPNVLGEAMATGIPCVATEVGEAAAIVGASGLVVPPRNPASLASAWRNLIDLGSEGRAERGRAARQRVVERYSLASAVARYEALFRALAPGRTPLSP